jgi:WD repeat-containing protein 23
VQNLIPNTNGTTVATYDHNIYTAQFSDDSSFYYTCAQGTLGWTDEGRRSDSRADFRLHIFDMTKPPQPFSQVSSNPSQRPQGMYSARRSMVRDGLATSLPLRKEIVGQAGNWTITDANLSPDNTRCVFPSFFQSDSCSSSSE